MTNRFSSKFNRNSVSWDNFLKPRIISWSYITYQLLICRGGGGCMSCLYWSFYKAYVSLDLLMGYRSCLAAEVLWLPHSTVVQQRHGRDVVTECTLCSIWFQAGPSTSCACCSVLLLPGASCVGQTLWCWKTGKLEVLCKHTPLMRAKLTMVVFLLIFVHL